MGKSELIHLCQQCQKCFQNVTALMSHTKWMHEQKHDKQCDQCCKTFLTNFNLNRHREVVHCNNTVKTKSVKCSICDFRAVSKSIVFTHYQDAHNIAFNTKTLSFKTPENFQAWKKETETKSNSQFVKFSSSHKRKNGSEISIYICHRDGNFVSKGKTNRNLKVQGSNKINSHCPAKIEVVATQQCITVNYIDTHVGHELDLGRMSVTNSEREAIAQKIAMKVPFEEILDEIRDSVTNSELNRTHLVNRKDLWNIVNSFNLNHEAVLSKNDYVSVDAWVSRMQSSSNSIRLYKPQGEILEEYPQLKEDDFFLVVMNDEQKAILHKFGDDCICIDRTRGLNACEVQLYTLMVLDDLRQGFPCSFLFSNREDILAMALFFKTIKDSLNYPLTTKTFMSDIDDIFYNAWSDTICPVKHRLYCSWHVDRAWRSNLNKIKGKDKQAAVYKSLKLLMFETNKHTFDLLCNTLFAHLNADPNTKEFAKYFEEFIENSTTWASCYRMESGINTNMSLENMHKVLKDFYFDGKKVKRLDKAIFLLMKFIRDKLFDRLITLNKGTITIKLQELRARHKRALTLTGLGLVEEENFWTVRYTKITDIYTIHRGNVECKCQLRCTECDACIHAYHCSCIDSAIKWNMCKHTHLLCLFLKNKSNDGMEASNTAENNNSLNVDEESIINEMSKETSLEKRKCEALDKVLQIHSIIENEEQVEAFMKQIVPLESVIKALSKEDITLPQVCEPPNKKVKCQEVFTKKPRVESGGLKNPSDIEKQALEMLCQNTIS